MLKMSVRRKLATLLTSGASLTADEIGKHRETLREHYKAVLGEIRTDIFDPDSRIELDCIFTHLYLLKESEKKRSDDSEQPKRHGIFFKYEKQLGKRKLTVKEDLSYQEFRKLISPGKPPYRILLIGEAGVGKTTFLAKLANDWRTGIDFNDIELLFCVPFREADKTEIFGDIVSKYLSDASRPGKRLDEHVRKNQNKVMILLDGLDEFNGDIKDCRALFDIMRGEKYKECVVIVSTRPRSDNQISRLETFQKFTRISVEGFNEASINEYVGKFFQDSEDLGEDLQQFLSLDRERNGVFSTVMAPFPIYLAMLCHLWQHASARKEFMTLETVSQLTNLMIHTIKEHFVLKDANVHEYDFEDHIKQLSICLANVGKLAFPERNGSLSRQLVFDEEACAECKDSIEAVCKVGLVIKEKTVAPMQVRQREGKRYVTEYRIPHLLMHDHLAATYLESLYSKSPSEFESKLKMLLEGSKDNIDRFEYLWYFTAAQGKAVGKAVLNVLKQEVDNTDFIIRVAFECHNKEVSAPVTKDLLGKRILCLEEKRTLPAYLYSMDTSRTLVS